MKNTGTLLLFLTFSLTDHSQINFVIELSDVIWL